MNAQSWFDLAMQPTQDPRSLIGMISFEDQANAAQAGTFTRSTNWLQAAIWVAPPMKVTPRATLTTAFIIAANPNDFASAEFAAAWNAAHAMTSINPQLPLVAEGLMYLKAGPFMNMVYLDITGGTTSTDVQISFRDNSYTSGDFTNGAAGTIPVFAFPTTTTYGGTGRALTVTLLKPGRYSMGIRIVDNAGNYSMFPMEWVVV
jgi:hypothetical protein